MEQKFILTSDEVLNQPGTYYNPATEVVVTVDDTNYIDQTQINLDEYSGKEWVLISETPMNNGSTIAEALQTQIELKGGLEATKDLSDTAEEQE